MSNEPFNKFRRDVLSLASGAPLLLAAGGGDPMRGQVPNASTTRSRGELSVTEFGARGDGSANDQLAMSTAVQAAVDAGCDLIIPAGTYRIDQPLNLGFAGLSVVGRGKAILRFTGHGPAVTIDAGEDRILYDNHLCNLLIAGDGRSPQDGLFVQNVVHSTRRNIRVTNVTGTAFHILGDVLSTYERCRVADNETARGISTPEINFHIGGSHLNKATTSCLFINCMAERASRTGWKVERCDNSRWIGGTAEGLGGVGLDIGKDSSGNSFDAFFLEHNQLGDIVCAGQDTQLLRCNATSAAPNSPYERVRSVLLTQDADGTIIDGLRAYSIQVAAGAKNTRVANSDISHRIDDQGIGTTIANCRQGYQSVARLPGQTLGNVDSADPTTLDWYQETRFTPALVSLGPDRKVSTVVATGSATRIGNVVTVTLSIRIERMPAGPTADIVIAGLPFPSARDVPSLCSAMIVGASPQPWLAQTEPGTDRLRIIHGANGAMTMLKTADLRAGAVLTVSGQYMV